jgi:hypothetical protein
VCVCSSCYIVSVPSLPADSSLTLSPRLKGVVILVTALVAAGVWFFAARYEHPGDVVLCGALARARVVTVYTADGASVRCQGVRTVPAEGAFGGEKPQALPTADALVAKLKAGKASAIAVVPNLKGHDKSVQGRLARFEHVQGLRGLVFTPALAIYAPAGNVGFSEKERTALTYIARALLRGAREPSLSSFPPSLRRVESVEVMVSINTTSGSRLLWRSTRGTSIPRALMAATRVARDRWHEREAAMGGPLRDRLNNLEVEVNLLVEDGVMASAEPTFIDRAVTKAHGLGFDFRSDWHYLMPSDVQKRGSGSAYHALTELGKDYAVSPGALAREETRLYRFVATEVGVSPPPPAAAQIRLKK